MANSVIKKCDEARQWSPVGGGLKARPAWQSWMPELVQRQGWARKLEGEESEAQGQRWYSVVDKAENGQRSEAMCLSCSVIVERVLDRKSVV